MTPLVIITLFLAVLSGTIFVYKEARKEHAMLIATTWIESMKNAYRHSDTVFELQELGSYINKNRYRVTVTMEQDMEVANLLRRIDKRIAELKTAK